jgi:protein-S-isoprenylcysteine O-methyltransferase Ste14
MTPRQISILGFVILVIALLGLIVRKEILANTPVTIAAQAIAVLLMIWARMTFGLRSFHASANPTEGGLVTTGPYRYLRHPIYASVLLFFVAAVISHFSLINLLLAAGAALGAALRICTEERLLLELYPDYRQYAARTRRIIPYLL